MKIADYIALFRQQCPIGTTLDAYIKKQADDGDPLALRLLAAERALTEGDYRLQYAGAIGLLCDFSPKITDEEAQERLDRAVSDWCEFTGWGWRRMFDRVDVFPPEVL